MERFVSHWERTTRQNKWIGLHSKSQRSCIDSTIVARIAIKEDSEIDGLDAQDTLDFSLPSLLQRQQKVRKNNIVEVYEHIWRGGLPQVLHADAELRQEYYNSYVDTYLMRDAMEAGGITDAVKFYKFLSACAALVAEPINCAPLAEAADISQPTAKEWVRLLEGMGILYLLRPYANNALKRLTKSPKLYFCDTGLCAYLSMWLTRDNLMNGAASGHFYENHVVLELLKTYASAKTSANLSYYRDSNAKEIDVFVEENNRIHPLEIKRSANPDRREVKKFELLDKAALERGCGGIVCMCEEVIPIDKRNCLIPCNLL